MGPGGENPETPEGDGVLVGAGGGREGELGEELDKSEDEVVRVLQPEDSILLRSLTGRPALGQGVTEAVNLGDEEGGSLGGDGDIGDPSLNDKTNGVVNDILGEVWNTQEEDLVDEGHDMGEYLDYEAYDDHELEESEGFLLQEGAAGPVIEYQEFVSLDPVKVFKER